MNRLLFQTRGLVCALLILTGCASVPGDDAEQPNTDVEATQPATNAPVEATTLTRAQSDQADERIRQLVRRDPLFALLTAELASQRGDFVSANIAYIEAARLQNDPELAKRALEISLGAGDNERALQAAQVWNTLAPTDSQASRSVLLLQLATNRIEEAYPTFEAYYQELKKQESAHPGVAEASPLRVMLELLVRIPDKNRSYETGLRLLGNDPKALEEQYILAQLAESCDFHDKAIAHLQHIIDVVPEERYYVLQAQFMERRDGNSASAEAFVQSLVSKNPSWFSARLYLARLATQDNRWPEADRWFKELIALQPTNVPLYSSRGFVLAKLNQRVEAAEYFNQYLSKTKPEDRQNEILIYLTMAELSQADKLYSEAIRWLERAPNGEQNFDIQLKKSNVLKSQDKSKQAEKVLRDFKPQNEDDSVRWALALSQLQESLKKPKDAAQVIEGVLKTYPDQPDLLYERAMVAERQDDLSNVEKYLRRLIAVKPDNPHGYNALGYTWADNNVRLPEALALIEKANQLAPKDPYILDSLGWVHFRMGNYGQAEQFLKAAFQIKPEEEIALHLMEVYWAQNRRDLIESLLNEMGPRMAESDKIKAWRKKLQASRL